MFWQHCRMATEYPLSRSEHEELDESFDEATHALITSAVEDQDVVSIDAIVDHQDAEQITDWLKDTTWYSDLDGELPWINDIDLYRTERESNPANDIGSV